LAHSPELLRPASQRSCRPVERPSARGPFPVRRAARQQLRAARFRRAFRSPCREKTGDRKHQRRRPTSANDPRSHFLLGKEVIAFLGLSKSHVSTTLVEGQARACAQIAPAPVSGKLELRDILKEAERTPLTIGPGADHVEIVEIATHLYLVRRA
jgi:hypothetical protein